MGKNSVAVILRFLKYELEELDALVRDYAALPRSSLVNISLSEFLHSPTEQDFQMCKKTKVNLALDRGMLSRLSHYAKTNGVHRTDLIHLAIRRFKQKYATPELSARKPSPPSNPAL